MTEAKELSGEEIADYKAEVAALKIANLSLEQTLKSDREKIRQEALDELYVDPCPKCGEGASFECFACRAKDAESKLSTLLKASEGMARVLEERNQGVDEYFDNISKQALADFRAVKEKRT